MHSTYFVTGAMLGVAGVNVAFPGVAPSLLHNYRNHRQQHQDDRQRTTEGITKHVKYYQWVPFVLVFQVTVNFYFLTKETLLLKGFNRLFKNFPSMNFNKLHVLPRILL